MLAHLTSVRPLLRRAIDVMEAFYDFERIEGIRHNEMRLFHQELHSLVSLSDRSTRETLARLTWDFCVSRDTPTVWFVKTFRPETTIILLIGTMANVSLEKILAADLSDAEFHRLNGCVSRLAWYLPPARQLPIALLKCSPCSDTSN